MRLDLRRGAEFGAVSAISFAITIPLNKILRSEVLEASEIIAGTIFTFCLCGIIGSLTDRIGTDIGEA